MTFSQRLKNYVILLLFIGYLLALPCSVFAMEQAGSKTDTIAVPRQQLMLLQTKLNQLESINEESVVRYQTLKKELEICQSELKVARIESKELKSQLTILEERSKNNENLLENANASLAIYKKEIQRKQARIKTQRDLAYLVAIGVILYSAKN